MPRVPENRRKSSQEKATERAAINFLKNVDKNCRTRAGKKAQPALLALENNTPGILEKIQKEANRGKPPKKADGKNIYSAKARSFTASFSNKFWRKHPFPCKCAKCGEDITEGATGNKAPSIDHKKDWATVKVGIATAIVCCNKVHWEVVYAADMRAAFEDENNLQPMHKSCNSAKNGSKVTDSIAPQKRGSCPKPRDCKESKGKS